MAKYFFIGGINEGGSPRGGAEAKNQFLLKKLQEIYSQQLDYIDMTSNRMNPTSRYVKLIKGLIQHQHIILSVASTALEKLAFMNFFLKKKKVTIFIIGGVVDQKLSSNRMRNLFENADISYAETKALTQSIINKSNKINVKHLPNFKELIKFSPHNKSNKGDTIKFVFLSRVHRDKGVFRAIDVIHKLNNEINHKHFILDIYGPIDLSNADKNEFEKHLDVQYINYKGYLDLSVSEAYTTLSEYHFFLFLTNHLGEGFPGVLIDALHSGTVIIASDWRYNNEIVPKTNKLVNLNMDYFIDIKSFVEEILNLNEADYFELIRSQQNNATKYNIDTINFEIA